MRGMEEIITNIIEILHKTKSGASLVHCLTNPLTANDCANMILSVGARPIMAQHPVEVEEITAKSKALVINIGSITDERIEAIFLSGKAARLHQIPIIFDPVGAAGSRLRKELSAKILEELQPDVIRGNLSEIKALAGIEIQTDGVDAAPEDKITGENIFSFAEIIKAFSIKQKAVVAATGKTDIIAYKEKVYLIQNGTPMLSHVTGTGCMCTSLMGAFCGQGNNLTGTMAASIVMGIAGELAELSSNGIGSFKVALFDQIYHISEEHIKERGKIIEYH